MKKNFIFLIILFLYSILNIQSLEFNLTNFVTMTIVEKLDAEKEHYFFIEAKKSQNATFYFYFDGHIQNVQYLSVSEYSDRNKNKPDIENEIPFTSIVPHTLNGKTLEFGSYIVSLPTTNYIAFKLIIKKEVSYFLTRIDCINGVYDLESGIPNKITNLSPGGTYLFYIPAYELQTVNIFLTTISTNLKPFESIYAYEYEFRNYTFFPKNTTQISNITSTMLNSQLNSVFSYTVLSDEIKPNYQTNYLVLKIVPKDISYLTIKMDNPVEYYDLISENQETLNNLNANTTYFFYCKGAKNKYAKIYVEADSLNKKPFNNIIIYEIANKTYYYNFKRVDVPTSFTSENNKASIFASYEIQSSDTRMIKFRINPLYNINSIKIKVDVQGFTYTLAHQETKTINNVKPGVQYSFYLSVRLLYFIKINLTTNYIDSEPFTKLMAFESPNFVFDYLTNKSLTLNSTKEGNQLVSIGSYRVSVERGDFFTLKVIPNSGINYMIVNFEIEKTIFHIDLGSDVPYYNLTAGRDYYVKITYWGTETNIIFEMSCKNDEKPFDYLYFSEDYTFTKINDKIAYKDLPIKKEGDKISFSYIYKVDHYLQTGFYIKFIPNYNLSYFKPQYKL